MKIYLDELIASSITDIQQNDNNVKTYRVLTEAIFCNLLLFNRRRVGELQRIPLQIYLNHHNSTWSKEFEKILTPSEKVLIKSLKRIVIKGKRGRGVPVLFDRVSADGLQVMIEKRNIHFEQYNEYLFALPGSETCISGYHVFRKHAAQALGDVSKSQCLTSTRLRKHLATICQILKMTTDDLEQLAQFMGHSSKTHNEWYRLPSDIYQTAKISKVLLLSQNNGISQFQGLNLQEINITDDILECAQSDSENDDNTVLPMEETAEKKVDNQSGPKKTKRHLKPWSNDEKKATEMFFREHIKYKKPPKKGEVMKLKEMYPELFKNREWATIKVYVQNKYK